MVRRLFVNNKNKRYKNMKKNYNAPDMKVAELNFREVFCNTSNMDVDNDTSAVQEQDGHITTGSREDTNLWDQEW